jgi:gluconate 2-dehydrogenase gamma chain
MDYSRRELLFGLAGMGGSSLVIPRIVRGELPAPEEERPFGAKERAILSAAAERMLPGAAEAGVPEYLDHWLVHRSFRVVRRYLAHGARHLEAVAGKKYSRPFTACSGERQDAILRAFAAGDFKSGKFDAGVFFSQLMELVLEGYLSDPKYGGNRNRAGWQLIGIPDGLRSCWWNPHGVDMVLSPDKGFQD